MLSFLLEILFIAEFNRMTGPTPVNTIMMAAKEDSSSISSEAY
jgi:hypothetical protein